MNKAIVTLIVVLAVGGGGAATYVYLNNSSEINSDTESVLEKESEKGSQGGGKVIGIGTIKSLINRGESLVCTIAHIERAGTTNGVTYIANGKIRGDIIIESENGNIESHVIVDNNIGYTWGTGLEDRGIMVNLNEITTPDGGNINSAINEQQFNYSCEKWEVDEDKFKLPKNIKFSDFTTEIKSIQNIEIDQGENQCEACNNIENNEAKNACLKAFGC